MRTRTLIVAPLAAFALMAPLAACGDASEEVVCAVVESDGDDYVRVPDESCPPAGAPAAASGPLWVYGSDLDTDDGGHISSAKAHRTPKPGSRTTVAPRPTTSSSKAPASTSAKKTTTSRSTSKSRSK